MNTEENYIQTGWGDSLEDITIEDVKEAINKIQEMDEEHGAFWVGIFDENEFILEVDKDRNMVGVFDSDSDEQLTYTAQNWQEVENLFGLFLNGDLDGLIKSMVKR